jgi:hypothetical protein
MTAFCQTKTYSVVLGVSLGCPGLVSTNEMACGFVCLCCAVLTSEWPCYTNEKSSDVKSSLLAKCCGQSNDYVACPNGRCPVLFRSPQPHQSDTIIHQLQEYLHGPDRLATLQPPSTFFSNTFPQARGITDLALGAYFYFQIIYFFQLSKAPWSL